MKKKVGRNEGNLNKIYLFTPMATNTKTIISFHPHQNIKKLMYTMFILQNLYVFFVIVKANKYRSIYHGAFESINSIFK